MRIEMDQEVTDLLLKLTMAVEATMNPDTPHQQRMEAYQVSKLCIYGIIAHRLFFFLNLFWLYNLFLDTRSTK